jgi:hypothetical protein
MDGNVVGVVVGNSVSGGLGIKEGALVGVPERKVCDGDSLGTDEGNAIGNCDGATSEEVDVDNKDGKELGNTVGDSGFGEVEGIKVGT